MALDGYDGEGTRVYSYLDDAGAPALETGIMTSLYDGSEKYAETIAEINNMALVSADPDWTFNSGNIVSLDDGTFETANFYARTAYAYAAGVGSYAYYNMVARVSFALLEGDVFRATIEGVDFYGEYLPICTAYFDEIGTAKDQEAEALFKDGYGLPKPVLDASSGKAIMSPTLSIDAKLIRHASSDLEHFDSVIQGRSEVSYTPDKYMAAVYDSEGKLLLRRQFEEDEGIMREVGLGLDNEPHRKDAAWRLLECR